MRVPSFSLFLFLLLFVFAPTNARRGGWGAGRATPAPWILPELLQINNTYLAHRNSVKVNLTNYGDPCDRWRIIVHFDGEVAFRQNCTVTGAPAYMSARPNETLRLAEWGREDIWWRPFKDTKNETNSFWSFQSVASLNWLSVDSQGRVSAIASRLPGQDETFIAVERFAEAPSEAERLSREASGLRSFRSLNGTYLRRRGHFRDVEMSLKKDSCAQWIIEDFKGTVRFSINISNAPFQEEYPVVIRSNCTGRYMPTYLRATSNTTVEVLGGKGDINWRPVNNQDGSWSFKTLDDAWLSADSGRVSLRHNFIGFTAPEQDQRFWLDSAAPPTPTPVPIITTRKPKPHRPVSTTTTKKPAPPAPRRIVLQQMLKTANGTYLRRESDVLTVDVAPFNEDACERWFLTVFNGTVSLRAFCTGNLTRSPMYLRAKFDGSVDVSEWEEKDDRFLFTLGKNEDGSHWLKSIAYDTYLSISSDGEVSLRRVDDNRGEEQKFWLESWGDKSEDGSAFFIVMVVFVVIVAVVVLFACCCTGGTDKKAERDSEVEYETLPLTDDTAHPTPIYTPLPEESNHHYVELQRTAQNEYYTSPNISQDASHHLHYAELQRPNQNYYYATTITLEPLSTQAAGQRSIRSVHGTYLRAWQGEEGQYDWFVDLAPHCDTCERWQMLDRDGKVVLRAYCFPAKYLRGNRDRSVDLADHVEEWEMWTPVLNDNGTWSFLSHHGTWLRAESDGAVSLQTHCMADEQFELGTW